MSGSSFFGLYTPATELDHHDGVRVSGPATPPIIDIGADEYQAP